MTDHDTRRQRGLDVLSTLSGSEDGGRALAGFFDTQGALGSIALHTAAGEVWSRSQFSRRDRSLVVISALTALGREVELRQHVAGGLNHGLTRDEVDEIMVQLGAYVGMPFAFGGAEIVAQVFAGFDGTEHRAAPPPPAEPKENTQRRLDGLDVLQTLLGMPEGVDMSAVAAATVEQLGDMGNLVVDFAFGEIWARPQLSRRDRSVVVISALAATNMTRELEIHIGGALNHGVTRKEVEEVMVTMVPYCGFPRAIEGFRLARKVFADRDAIS
ncbi:MAG: carboxymuconolactone decarboxylase family protein [Candidatus Binatia bacterium]|nr:carboxymuconolactone decarboxylase family protein [Candidatus Binatia bacterium]